MPILFMARRTSSSFVGHKVEIRLSDVATAHLAKTGFSAGFVLKENSS